MSQNAIQKITWSYSRRSTLEQCTRRYYYEYFGSSKRTAKEEPYKDELHFLKNRVHNRYLLSGSALHTVIRSYFKNAQKGDIWDVNRLVNFALKIFRDSWTYSEKHPDGKFVPDGPYPPKLLQEYYDRHPKADQLCADEETRLINAINSFATDDIYEEFRVEGSKQGALVEQRIILNEFPCKVSGIVDLAFKKGHEVTIADWKLGANDGTGDGSLQLAVYALWAIDYFKCEPANLNVYKAHLSSNDVASFRADAQALAAARARIIQDAERMSLLKSYGQSADVEAFTRCEKPAICSMCSYRSVCYD
jgi:hypothetical protein